MRTLFGLLIASIVLMTGLGSAHADNTIVLGAKPPLPPGYENWPSQTEICSQQLNSIEYRHYGTDATVSVSVLRAMGDAVLYDIDMRSVSNGNIRHVVWSLNDKGGWVQTNDPSDVMRQQIGLAAIQVKTHLFDPTSILGRCKEGLTLDLSKLPR
jgi:hypothetical protein